MGYTPSPPALVVLGQSAASFVPTAQLPTGTPANTRRVIQSASTGAGAVTPSGYQDLNARIGLTWPVNATRMRFRIRNANVNASSVITTAIALTGAFIGTPNVASENAWSGDFASAPTSLSLSFAATDIGTAEYVSGWVTPTGQKANQLFGLSLGFTCATDSSINTESVPGWTFHGATGAGASSAAGNAAIPSGGGITATPNNLPFDIRIEYEFVGQNQIGFYIGTSLTSGWVGLAGIGSAYGHMGPDNTWPGMVGNRLGHGIANGGFGGAITAQWATLTNQCWTRFKDPTTGNIFGGSLPDYAVIDLGVNDPFSATSLATFQANIQSVIGFLHGLGIYRIYACTAPMGIMTSLGNLSTSQNGQLNAALAAGAITSLVLQAMQTTITNYQTNYPSAPGGGPTSGSGSGAITSWYNASSGANQCWLELPSSGIAEGPLTVTAASGTTILALTVSSFTLAHAHKVGAPVLSLCEGYRQNYNHWLRQVPPGIIGTIDFAKIAEIGGPPPIQKNWYYYGQADDVHPPTPALYAAFAQEFAAGLIGL